MFDNLSDRLGGVFDKLKGRGALPEKVVSTFSVWQRDCNGWAALPEKVFPTFSVRQRDQHKIAAGNVKGIAHV